MCTCALASISSSLTVQSPNKENVVNSEAFLVHKKKIARLFYMEEVMSIMTETTPHLADGPPYNANVMGFDCQHPGAAPPLWLVINY